MLKFSSNVFIVASKVNLCYSEGDIDKRISMAAYSIRFQSISYVWGVSVYFAKFR